VYANRKKATQITATLTWDIDLRGFRTMLSSDRKERYFI